MKQYRVTRSIFGDIGSHRRNAILLGNDQRLVDNPKAVKDLLQKKLLVEEPVPEKSTGKKPAGKAK